MRRIIHAGAASAAMLIFGVADALAHASDRGHVLLLPTGYYLVGGALAVLASFAILAFVPASPLDAVMRKRWPLPVRPRAGQTVVSTLSFCFFAILICAGWYGSRDPLANPLPLVFWSLLWSGFVIVQGVFGNLWAWLNPWYGPWRIATALIGRRTPVLQWPRALSLWPAFAGLALFAWFELAHPAPDDPSRLATVIAAYWLLSFLGMLAFGYRRWTARAEFLSLFMAMIAKLSIVEAGRRWRLRLPAAGLIDAPALPASGVAFLLLALASVTFDGLRHTFFWLGAIGINPLEFPGRSAVMGETTFGLAGAFALLSGAFIGAVTLGHRMADAKTPVATAIARLVWTIIPISFAYHVAHYLPALLVDGQYALVALSDPFASGMNLLGTAHYHVQAGLTVGADSVWIIWNIQAFSIIGGHVLAVIATHIVAGRIYGEGRMAVLSQIPLVTLMIGYTVVGLWLLSTPTGL